MRTMQRQQYDYITSKCKKMFSLFCLACIHVHIERRANLAGLHRFGDEGRLGHKLGCAQQVPHTIYITFVLLHWLHPHLLLGQQGLITWRVTQGRKELEIAMATPQQETHSEKTKSNTGLSSVADTRFL